MRIIFAGSSPFSISSLKLIIKKISFKKDSASAQTSSEPITLVSVLTTPDRPSGRGMKMKATPVKELAMRHNILVLQPEYLRADAIAEIKALNPDILVCSSYGKIFGPTFLSLFSRGTVNIHPSLLPRFRGAAPVPAAILAEDLHTGVTLQKISQEMDCGDIILQSRYTISDSDTTESLLNALSREGSVLLDTLLDNFDDIYARSYAQTPAEAVYCRKIVSSFGYLTWSESAQRIAVLTRAFSNPYTGVKVKYKHETITLWKVKAISNEILDDVSCVGKILGVDPAQGILVQCRRGVLALQELQKPFHKRLAWKEFLQGESNFLNVTLT